MPGKGLLIHNQAPKKKQLGGWATCSPVALAEGVGEVGANKAELGSAGLDLAAGPGEALAGSCPQFLHRHLKRR